MRYYFLCLVFGIVTFPFKSFSQEKKSHNLKFRIGYTNTVNSKSVFDFIGENKHRRINSIFLGFSFEHLLTQNNSIQLGASIVNKGHKTSAKAKYDDHEYDLNYRFDLNYFEVPITLIHRMKKINLLAGANYSFLTRASWNAYHYEKVRNFSKTEYVYQTEITSIMKRHDFGIHVGVSGKMFPFLGWELILQKNFFEPYVVNYELAKQQTLFIGLQYFIY